MLEQLGLIGNVAVLIASLAVLLKASSLAITNSINLSSASGLGKTKIGFILVAFSTSLPELFVAAFSIMGSQTIGISVGNVLGSNIVNICLILGVSFLIMAIKYPKSAGFFTSMAKDEVGDLNFGIFVASIVPLILLYVGNVSQVVGLLLVALFFYNMYELAKKRATVEEISAEAETRHLGEYVFKALIGMFGVVICSYFIVNSASFLALSVGIPQVIVGATVVAFGTSLPELSTSISSVSKGFLDLALGNVIGSCFINITLILGVTFLLSPFNVNIAAFRNIVLISLMSNTVLWYLLQNTKVNKREGAILIAIYAVFVAVSFSGG